MCGSWQSMSIISIVHSFRSPTYRKSTTMCGSICFVILNPLIRLLRKLSAEAITDSTPRTMLMPAKWCSSFVSILKKTRNRLTFPQHKISLSAFSTNG